MALKKLDERHYRVIELLLEGAKTNRQIAEEVGVHYNTITNWQKDELFQREFKRTLQTHTQPKLRLLIDSMIANAITEGNAAMAKLVLQMNDMLTDKVEVKQTGDGDNVNREELRARLESLRSQSDK